MRPLKIVLIMYRSDASSLNSVGDFDSANNVCSASLREMVGLGEGSVGRVHPQAVEEMTVEDT